MHVDGLYDACRDEWDDAVRRAAGYGIDWLDERPDESEMGWPDDPALSAAEFGVGRVLECVSWQDALAYVLCSGVHFMALNGEVERDRCVREVMLAEVRERIELALGDAGED